MCTTTISSAVSLHYDEVKLYLHLSIAPCLVDKMQCRRGRDRSSQTGTKTPTFYDIIFSCSVDGYVHHNF